MTVCMAAICQKDGKPRIALCADALASTATAASETAFKIEILSPQPLAALFAGWISDAHELLSMYRYADLPTLSETKAHVLQQAFRVTVQDYKRRRIESLVRQRLGLSYDEFLERSGQIESGIRTRVAYQINNLAVGVELLLAGFGLGGQLYPAFRSGGASPFLYLVREDVWPVRAFAAIGSGAEAAAHTLHRRAQNPACSFEETLYNLYEAKKFAELAPTVGKDSVSMAVMEPPIEPGGAPSLQGITPEGMNFLRSCYRRYGPKPVKRLNVPPDLQILAPLP